MKSKGWMALAGLALLGASAFGGERPNILFLCIDDLKPELGCYGDKNIKSPNIDRLSEQGVQFNRHYVQQAVCACSRTSMFSGLRPDMTRIWDLSHNARTENPSIFTMQEYFKKQGYTTIGAGKVLHGFKNEDPQSWSVPFRHDADLPYNPDYPPPADDQYQSEAFRKAFAEMEKSGIKGYRKRKKWLEKRGVRPPVECNLDLPDDAYADGAIANYGIQQLEKFSKSGKPFFLTLGFHKPHLPFVAPKKYWDLYPDDSIHLAAFRRHATNSPAFAYQTWGELRNYSGMPKKGDLTDDQQRKLIHAYYACVSYVDAQVGRVLDALHKTGLDKNTIVVLWGDHGWHLGDHGLWCKHTNFEQATRSPLIISAPGLSRGKQSEAMVESVDIFPTLCELSGVPVPDVLQGKSLVPLLRNPQAEGKAFAMSQYPRQNYRLMGYALRTPRYRLVAWMKGEIRNTGKFDPANIVALELYDYKNDPLETANLAKNPEYAEIVKKLTGELQAYFENDDKE